MTTAMVSLPASSVLCASQQRTLRTVVGAMIPASAEYEVPGADDDNIFTDITRSLGRDTQQVHRAVQILDQFAGGSLADSGVATRDAAIAKLRADHPALLATLVAVTTRCYYRDDRVMRSLGMEVRPPYPGGFTVEQGDWSLLQPVRERGRIWRDAP